MCLCSFLLECQLAISWWGLRFLWCGGILILDKVFRIETLQLLHCTLTLLVIVMFYRWLRLLRGLIIISLLLGKVFLIAHCLVVKGLAVLEDLHLILIELHCFVVFQSLIHYLFGLVITCQISLGSSRAPTEITPLHVQNCYLLP